MITLASLLTQLSDQLFAASLSAMPTATRTEAIRQALGTINARFAAIHTISGLDGASSTTLPDSAGSTLLLGASAFVLDFVIRSRFVGYHETPEVSEKLILWAGRMKDEFDAALERLRLVELQQSTNPPSFQITSTSSAYEEYFDT